jgi:hypothetical protein
MKTNNRQKIREKPYANRTHGYEMMINNNNENLRRESCCLPQIASDEHALAMMCERNAKPRPNVITR